MVIEEQRVVVKACDFERTCRFYGEVMALPRLRAWERDEGRGALFQAGPGTIEVRGRPAGDDRHYEDFDYQGPEHKLTVTLVTPSAEKAYDELIFREKNIPGGLIQLPDGVKAFETRDPDGVKILLREPGNGES